MDKTANYLKAVWGYDETMRLLQVSERKLAFAMGHHPRLGDRSALSKFSPDELMRMILDFADRDKVSLDPRIR